MANNDSRRLGDLTVGDAKRILVYGIMLALAIVLFGMLIGHVLVALLLGIVVAVYLLPIQEWLEKHLRARAGSALISIALIVVPLVVLTGYTWHELYSYSTLVTEKNKSGEIIDSISNSLESYLPGIKEGTRKTLQAVFSGAVTRSANAIQSLKDRSALLLSSLAVFFFTVFYVVTQRTRIAAYIKVRVPGDYLPLYEKLTENVGGALRGALRAVFIDQCLKGAIIIILNLVFDIPLPVVLGLVTFLLGFFPLVGEWAVYVPISIYLFVFRGQEASAAIYFGIGLMMTLGSSLILRPKLASKGARRFSFYWMFLSLVAGVYVFGIPGIVLGPAILGFVKAVSDTLFGDVRYETSLLKSENEQKQEEAAQPQPASGAAD